MECSSHQSWRLRRPQLPSFYAKEVEWHKLTCASFSNTSGQVLLLDRSRAPSRDPSPHDLRHRRTSAEACAASWHALWKRGKELEQHANAESLFDLPAKLVEQVLTVRLMDMPHFWKSSTADVQQYRNPFQIHPLWSCMIWIDNNKLWSFCF